MENKTILVTGGCGFIGSNFILYEIKNHPNDKIINIDSLTYAGNLENLKDIESNPSYTFYNIDITDEGPIDSVISKEKPDIIVNFAAETHVDRSIANPTPFIKTNVMGTVNLLSSALKNNVKRFHQVSTDEVYGDLPLTDKELLFKEDSPIKPSSPYSASKASADFMVMAFLRTYGLGVSISRCSNNYGPYQFPEKLIPLIIKNALNDESIPVYGEGKNIRDWLYVEDHASAIDTIIRSSKDGSIYNVGGNNERENIEIVKTILDILEKPYSLIRFVEDRKGHDLRYAIDSSKLQEELKWKPKTSFKEGIERTVKWYLDNRGWWERIINGEYKNYYSLMYGEKLK